MVVIDAQHHAQLRAVDDGRTVATFDELVFAAAFAPTAGVVITRGGDRVSVWRP